MDRKIKVMVMGYGRHGKDTVADILTEVFGLKACASSLFAAGKVVRPYLEAKLGISYASDEDCYNDRHQSSIMRQYWYDAISAFNRPDATALARAIFAEYDIYVGVRSAREFHAARNTGVFDFAIWVDASGRGVPPEDRSSCTVEPWMADFVIDNSGPIRETKLVLKTLVARLILGLQS